MRDLVVLAIVFGSLPIALFRPFVGLSVYAWLAYMRPQDLAWEIASMPLSKYVAVATLLGLLMAIGRERALTLRLPTVLLILTGVWFWITCQTAFVPEISQKWLEIFLKLIAISLLTTGLVRTKLRFQTFMIVVAFSLGLLGLKNGVYAILHGGARFLSGPGGFMAGNNAYAVALNMAIPLLVAVGASTRNRLLKYTAYGLVPFCMVTILGTFSRGGLLTLGLVAAALVWRTRRPVLAALLVVAGIGGFFYISPEDLQQSYVNRSSTILEYDDDASAMGRITAWKASWRAFTDYPLLGVGPRNFTTVSRRYSSSNKRLVAHSSYFQILAESGLPGFALFVGLAAVALLRLDRIRRRFGPEWPGIYAGLMQVSIGAYLAGSLFLNLGYFELFYQLAALTVSLEVAVEEPVESRLAAPAAAAVPWWRQPRPAGVEGSR